MTWNTFHEKYQELSEDPRRPLVNSHQASTPSDQP